LVHTDAVAASERVVLLCLDVTATNRDRIQFIGADAAEKELLTAGGCVERPPTRSLHDWNRKRPVLVADEEERSGLVFRVQGDALLLADLRDEVAGSLTALRGFAGKNDVVDRGPEKLGERTDVEAFGGVNQGIGSLLRSRKALDGCRRSTGGGGRRAAENGRCSDMRTSQRQVRPTNRRRNFWG
jgi:hypothetical protein